MGDHSKVHYLAVSETTLNRLADVARPSSRRSECSLRASFRTKSPLVQTNEALLKRITELESKLSYMESDYKEMKENVEFAASEQSVLAEELREAQAALEAEKSHRKNDREQYETEIASKQEAIRRLAATADQLRTEKTRLEALAAEKDDTLQRLAAKFQRNRDVWLQNESKANDEIRKLDNIIDNIVNALSDAVQLDGDQFPRLKRLYSELTAHRANGGNGNQLITTPKIDR